MGPHSGGASVKTTLHFVCCIALLMLGGCEAVSSMPRPDNAYGRYTPPAPQSLLPAEGGQMDDQAVARALNYRVTEPARIRLALMQLPDEGTLWLHYGFGIDPGQTDLYSDFVAALRASPRLYDASYLPDLLLPEKRTLPALREAAARYQADMLLVFRPRCDLFTDVHLFKPDEVHAYCIVQAVLLDTRSGVVPFTSSATEDMVAVKQDSDLDFDVTVRNTRNQAVQKGLMEVAHNTLGYIQGLPQSP